MYSSLFSGRFPIPTQSTSRDAVSWESEGSKAHPVGGHPLHLANRGTLRHKGFPSPFMFEVNKCPPGLMETSDSFEISCFPVSLWNFHDSFYAKSFTSPNFSCRNLNLIKTLLDYPPFYLATLGDWYLTIGNLLDLD